MKLFGSKDNDEALNEGLDEDSFDVAFDSDDAGGLDLDAAEGDGGAGLSAPSRDFGDGKKSRKGLLILLLLLLAGGGAGGYYYLAMMGADEPMGVPKAAQTLPGGAAAPAPTIIGADMPPMPQPEVDTTIAQPSIGIETPDPFAAMEAATPQPETGADIAAAIDMPGFDTPVTDDTAMVEDPFSAMGEPAPAMSADVTAIAPADAVVMGMDSMPPPTEDMATAVPMEDFVVVDAPVETEDPAAAITNIPGDLPPPETGAKDPSLEAAPAEALPAPAFDEMAERTASQPAADLPMPDVTDVMAATGVDEAPPSMIETTTSSAGGPTDTVAPSGASAPTDAEKAIVENAAMMDQLSAPATATAADPAAAGKTAAEILGERAIIRRLPDTYIVVRKDHSTGDLDTRLKVARMALMENRFTAAVQMFDALAADYPRDERVMMGRALSLQQAGRVDDALNAYEVVLSANPKKLEALTNMLGVLKGTNPALAVQKLEELRTVYPYNADIAAQLGTSYGALKNYDAALQYLDMADALAPGNAYVYYNKAVLYDHMGQQNMATSMYRRILQMHAEGILHEPLPLEAIRRRLSSMR
jgi:Flp pilus assembly protein TadD